MCSIRQAANSAGNIETVCSVDTKERPLRAMCITDYIAQWMTKQHLTIFNKNIHVVNYVAQGGNYRDPLPVLASSTSASEREVTSRSCRPPFLTHMVWMWLTFCAMCVCVDIFHRDGVQEVSELDRTHISSMAHVTTPVLPLLQEFILYDVSTLNTWAHTINVNICIELLNKSHCIGSRSHRYHSF